MPGRKPMLIISYDDCPEKDYTKAFPVHLRYNVPAEISVVSDCVGRPAYLTLAQLREMQDAGFEIVSHTKRHKVLKGTPLTRGANHRAYKVYVDKVRFEGCTCLIRKDGDSQIVRVTKKGKDFHGTFARLDSRLQREFSRPAEITLAEEELLTEIEQSKEALLAMGLNVSNFTYPFNLYSDESKELVSRYYDSARASGNFGLNLPHAFDKYALCSKNFLFLSERKIIEVLNETVRANALCIFYTHTWQSAFSEDKLKFVIKRARERGIEIVTRRQALQSLSQQT